MPDIDAAELPEDGASPLSISPDLLRQADAQYEPFPSVVDWGKQSFDSTLWEERLARLQAQRSSVDAEAIERATASTMRLAAVDTGAIEGLYEVDRGFTFSVAVQMAGWEFEMDKRGSQVRPLFEAQLKGFELVLDAATQNTPLSEAFVRALHEALTSAQESFVVYTSQGRQEQPLPRGVYKTQPNHPWDKDGLRHAYAPVADTPAEMHRLIEETRRPEFDALHPTAQAAYLHYAFVSVHPFADGNGRVARALASIPLFKAASVPFLVFADQKDQYLNALAAADSGSYGAFTEFTYDRSVAALTRFADILRTGSKPSVTDSLDGLTQLHEAMPGITFAELDDGLSRLRAFFGEEGERQLRALTLPSKAKWTQGNTSNAKPTAGYRVAINPQVTGYYMGLQSEAPAQAATNRLFDFEVTTRRTRHAAFLIRTRESSEAFEFDIADVMPDLSVDARFRISTIITGSIAELAAELRSTADAYMRSAGYITD